MEKRRIPEVPITLPKPNVSVGTGLLRSKPTSTTETTTRGSQASRSIVGLTPPPSRSKAISGLSIPSSTNRAKGKGIDPLPTSRFFSKSDIAGQSSQQRAKVGLISGSILRAKLSTSTIVGVKPRFYVGGGPILKNTDRSGPLRVSDL